MSSTSLEANLQIALITRTQQTELLPIESSDEPGTTDSRHNQLEDDRSSSLHDAPPLPDGVSVVGHLSDPSEGEQPEENKDSRVPVLYAGIPQGIETGTEGGDQSCFDFLQIDSAVPSSSTCQAKFKLHELSGQSRVLLKEYFETTDAFPLPLGHPTVAFSETQLYHLLNIFTNETMSLTYTTMEKMVLDEV